MSIIWKMVTGKEEPWKQACVDHDRKYWAGGSKHDRYLADIDLAVDVSEAGYFYWAYLMFIAVMFGGSGYLPLPWRWGFGYSYWDSIRHGFYEKEDRDE